MREIKFRGKRVDNGEWVFGSILNRKIENKSFIIKSIWFKDSYNTKTKKEKHTTYADCYEVIPKTVGQYRNESDNKGVEIFDGDIMACRDGNGEIHLIEVKWSDSIDNYVFNSEIEHIAGNIHDNKDLLNRENK